MVCLLLECLYPSKSKLISLFAVQLLCLQENLFLDSCNSDGNIYVLASAVQYLSHDKCYLSLLELWPIIRQGTWDSLSVPSLQWGELLYNPTPTADYLSYGGIALDL